MSPRRKNVRHAGCIETFRQNRPDVTTKGARHRASLIGATTLSLCLCVMALAPTENSFATTKPPQTLGDNLTPAHALPFITGQIGFTGHGSMVPVTVLPFTSGLAMSKFKSPPKFVLAPVPPAVAKRVSAYLYPVNEGEWAYVIAPRGMTGNAGLGTDGSGGFNLQSPDATLSFDHVGGSTFMAQGAAALFFPAAGQALNRDNAGVKDVTPWSRQDLLQHANLSYRDHNHLALFAFTSTSHHFVYGYAFYQPDMNRTGAFNTQAEFDFSSDQRYRDLAPYVMASGLTTLIQIGDPSLAGTAIAMQSRTVVSGGRDWQLTAPKGLAGTTMALATPRGVAFIQEPGFTQTATNSPYAKIPNTYYGISLSASTTRNLTAEQTIRGLALIPPYQLGPWTDEPLYAYVNLSRSAGPNWLLYTTTWAGIGMVQPEDNALFAVSLQAANKAPMRITSYLNGGSYFFSYGTYGSIVVYDESNDLSPKGATIQNIGMIDLRTGERTYLPSSDLHDGVITVGVAGRIVHIPLRQE